MKLGTNFAFPCGGLNFDIFRGSREPAPQIWRNFSKICIKYLKIAPRKTGSPQNLIFTKLCRQIISKCNQQLQQMICAQGSRRQPPKYDHRFLDKFTNFSLLPLTPLECPYENFPHYPIFSICLPLSDDGESVRISGPNTEIGGPKEGKIWRALCINSKPNFLRFLAYELSFGSTIGMQTFMWGRDPLPEILAKNHFALPISTRNANFSAT